MSNTTARDNIIVRIAGEIDDALRPVVALDCADLAALAAADQAAAAAQLAALTEPQLVTQAQAYASYLNAKYCDDVTGEQVLAIFQRCIAKHTPEVPMYTTLTIARPGLAEVVVTVNANSTASITEFAPDGGQPSYDLVVDGVAYFLCFWKHTIGRPELLAEVDAALADVHAAIAALSCEASAPAPAAADHTAPDTSNTSNEETSMTRIIFSRDAHIDSSESELPLITTLSLDPSLVVALRLLLETQHASPQFYRALNGDGKRVGALRRLLDGTSFRFDPNTRLLHIVSASDAGHVYATDGAACDCKGASHAWCWHRCAWHVVVLALALTDPHGLLAPVPLVFVTPNQPARLAA
jgi:hypothetical protein